MDRQDEQDFAFILPILSIHVVPGSSNEPHHYSQTMEDHRR